MSEIFVSYKREDRERVRALVEALRAVGLPVWWDEQIPAGVPFRAEIDRRLSEAACVIVVWSKSSIDPTAGAFVHDEAERARARGVLVPVKIDPVTPPVGFGQLQTFELGRVGPDDPSWPGLVTTLSRLCGTAPRADSGQRSRKPWFAALSLVSVLSLGAGAFLFHARTPARCPPESRLIPEGEVHLSTTQGLTLDGPTTAVSVAPFCLAQTEVRQVDYRRCFSLGGCDAAREARINDAEIERRMRPFCTFDHPELATHPINCVTWQMAEKYCRWLGGRLPTEGEWQLAAQPDPALPFPWGEGAPSAKRLNALGPEGYDAALQMLGEHANRTLVPLFDTSDGFAATAPVGSFPAGASPSGLQDMAGNVSEWTSSGTEADRHLRGSAWTYAGNADGGLRGELFVTFRRTLDSRFATPTLGVRCAFTP